MRLGFGLSQEQIQKLAVTPELRLAIKILQFSAAELSEFVEEQLVDNPVLEVLNGSDQEAGDDNTEETRRDIDWEQYFKESAKDTREENRINQNDQVRFEHIIPDVPTLQEHLLFQLVLADLAKEEKRIGEFIIGNIDDNGYLQCTNREIADYFRQPVSLVEKIVRVIQGFEPLGVGAKDLKECLLIQYDLLGMNAPLLHKIITDHLDDVANSKIVHISKKEKTPLNEVQQALDLLKLLEPKPGRNFSSNMGTKYILPDIIVEKIDNEYIILVNDISMPRLSINQDYRKIILEMNGDKEGRKYVEGKLASATWLLKSIEQRRMTLYKVARSIVDYQRDFFDQGVAYLKPLTLRTIADKLGIHESTVSRATSNKYMQTPRGVFEMKFFFSSGSFNMEGHIASGEAVKKRMKELIAQEDPKKPLSDQKIADMLKKQGVEISRRTVTKYREEQGILASSHRRRY